MWGDIICHLFFLHPEDMKLDELEEEVTGQTSLQTL